MPYTTTPTHLGVLFPQERGPADFERRIACAELQEWPALWTLAPLLLPMLGEDELAARVRAHPHKLRYFAAMDPAFPHVPLLRLDRVESRPDDTWEPRLASAASIRARFGNAASSPKVDFSRNRTLRRPR
jgi:hypothetical protein